MTDKFEIRNLGDLQSMPRELKVALLRSLKSVLDEEVGDPNAPTAYENRVSEAGQLVRLAEVAHLYGKMMEGCQFGPGDLVTPMAQYPIKGHGTAHIVLEVLPTPPAPAFDNEKHSPDNGIRQDMRVAVFRDDVILTYWVESFMYEPFVAKED